MVTYLEITYVSGRTQVFHCMETHESAGYFYITSLKDTKAYPCLSKAGVQVEVIPVQDIKRYIVVKE